MVRTHCLIPVVPSPLPNEALESVGWALVGWFLGLGHTRLAEGGVVVQVSLVVSFLTLLKKLSSGGARMYRVCSCIRAKSGDKAGSFPCLLVAIGSFSLLSWWSSGQVCVSRLGMVS